MSFPSNLHHDELSVNLYFGCCHEYVTACRPTNNAKRLTPVKTDAAIQSGREARLAHTA